MNSEDFQAHVIRALSALSRASSALELGQAQVIERQTHVIERLDKMNGSVKDLYLRTDANTTNLLKHISDCPLRQEIEAIKLMMSNHEAEKKNSEKWINILKPLIWVFLTAIATLILSHAHELIKK
jgi:hypothetical protein